MNWKHFKGRFKKSQSLTEYKDKELASRKTHNSVKETALVYDLGLIPADSN